MKIGAFAKLFGVSNDTVRYYIELGLLLPNKKNTHYQMNQSCLDDMAFITQLKTFHFSLQEIQKILSYQRVTNFMDHEDIAYYNTLLTDKKQQLIQEKKKLAQTIQSIEQTIDMSRSKTKNEHHRGVPISFIPMLYCPTCQTPLEIKDVAIKQTSIEKGYLTCACGYEALIEEGIIITANLYKVSPYPSYFYDIQTIREMNHGMINLFEKSNTWFQKILSGLDLKHKLIVETNIDVFVTLPKYIEKLDAHASYVFSGYSLDMLKKVRKRMEIIRPELDILYILNSDLHLPLKAQSIDVFIDSFATSDFSLLNPIFPLQLLKEQFHRDTVIVGGYTYYENAAKSLNNILAKYPNADDQVLHHDYIEKNLVLTGFHITQSETIGHCSDPGPFFDYHEKEDKFHMLMYVADAARL